MDANQLHTYTCTVFEHTKTPGVYDVEIVIDKRPSSETRIRKIVYKVQVSVSKMVSMPQLAQYMRWKFKHCQDIKDARIVNLRKKGLFICVKNDLNWIKSIIDAEFDYHVGNQITAQIENIDIVKEYQKNEFTGFGPYMSIYTPTEPINIRE